ncbi:hypothetical protein [Aliikangiella coralliicola]|uniref:Uncharacterized protein n=1 Tax=Aliikangiella coralliicola TaxID=2592383 RepID=A0A545U044_9GAMM|nr:hypothetical protein [Aliikangiella coralliicola]TQV82831.1 hypothetical protein FLL46_23980 [Aliikangiella coralliicola]
MSIGSFLGKKEIPLKTKTTTYCHKVFTDLCKFLRTKHAALLRDLAIYACIVWEHPRFKELEKKLRQSPLNEKAIIDDLINSYLDGEKSKVVSIHRNRRG